jgi:crotonobetaine/carnitine-CoA ligase
MSLQTTTAETIGQLLDAAVGEHPHKEISLFHKQIYTYAETKAMSDRAAAPLLRYGIRHGDRVAVMLVNCPEFLFVWFGLAKIGAVLLPLNPAAQGPEVAGLLAQAGPRLAVANHQQQALLKSAAASCGLMLQQVEPGHLLEAQHEGFPDVGVAPDDVGVLMNTSGTTGSPKLVMQTHRAYVLAGQGFPWWLGLTEQDRFLTALPLFHSNALLYSVLGSLAAGASLVLLPRFSATTFWEQARRYRATQFNAIGAIVEILMRQAPQPDDAQHTVRLCYSGPALPKDHHVEFEHRFGLRLLVGYGLSESPYGTIWPLDGPPPYESLGRLRQHPRLGEINRARVVDTAGRDVATGEVGEFLLSNPAVMKGYFGLPHETAEVLRDGWLHTGDLVRADGHGVFYFVARKKEVIRRRGENLAPTEVEDVLNAHPAVTEAAVVGVPAELSEEDVKAFVVYAGELRPEPEELRSWCAQRLSLFKVPRYIEFVDALPRTPTARIARYLLPRERTTAEYDAEKHLA